MKRIAFAVLAVLAAVGAGVVMQGCAVLGGPPASVQVAALTDTTVQIAWSAPSEGNPDKYVVYFRPVHESSFAVLGETTGTSYTHHPDGYTGTYKIVAVFGSDTYNATTEPTTIPVRGDSVTVAELNADSSIAGYGWSRTTGAAGVYSMADSASAGDVDFYVSDLLPGYDRLPYALVSPDMADTIDQGATGIVPHAAWRVNGFSNALSDEQAPLPAYTASPANYFNYTEVTQQTLVACYTAGEDEKHYALIKVLSVDPATGHMTLETWFQLVGGLRLIRH